MNYAVESVGKDVLLVQNNQIVGKGVSQIARGDVFVGIQITEGALVERVQGLDLVKFMGLKHSYFRFCPVTGAYLGDDSQTGAGGFDLLGEVRVVDAFNLRWGMVPAWFAGVPGYRAGLEVVRGADE